MASSLRRWLFPATLVLLPLGVALALYAPVLTLPFFWDDYPQYNFATTKSYWSLWTNATGLPYYRPLTFSINKLLFEILPKGATLVPHLFVLGGHLVASLLVGQVAAALYARQNRAPVDARAIGWVALVASLAFAVYPFATLSVSYFSGANHVWATAVTLLGVAAVLQYSRDGNRGWALAALGAGIVAETLHEGGVMAGPVMVASLWLFDRRFAWRHKWFLTAVLVVSLGFLALWLWVPKSRDANTASFALGDGAEILAKLSFFLQAPSFPFQPLAALLISRLQFWDLGAIWLCGLPPLLAAGAWLRRRGHGLVLGFAVVWTVLTLLPTVLALHFDYIADSQRLLYYCGPAAAVLWGVVLAELVRAGRGRAQRVADLALATVLAAATLGVPFVYALREARLHQLALAPLQQLDQVARQYPHDRHLIINTVNWLSYRQAWYPLGHDGITVLAPYLSLQDLIYLNTGVRLTATVATFPDLLPTFDQHYLSTANEGPGELWNTTVFAAHIAGVDHTWFTSYTDAQATLQDVGHVNAAPRQPPSRYLGRFENSVYLLGGSFTVAGQVLNLSLDWLYLGPDPNATIFRNVFDCAGNVAGLGSGHALGTMLPFGGLPGGTNLHDVRSIPLEARSTDGCYQVEVGLFRPDGSRVPVLSMDGSALKNYLVLIKP